MDQFLVRIRRYFSVDFWVEASNKQPNMQVGISAGFK